MCCFDTAQATIDILKIDIECSEWTSFDAILASPQCLANVKQLMVEFHPCYFKRGVTTPQTLLSHWRTLREIDKLGFKLWKVWNNYVCRFQSKTLRTVYYYGCFNAYFLNIKYIIWCLNYKHIKTRGAASFGPIVNTKIISSTLPILPGNLPEIFVFIWTQTNIVCRPIWHRFWDTQRK